MTTNRTASMLTNRDLKQLHAACAAVSSRDAAHIRSVYNDAQGAKGASGDALRGWVRRWLRRIETLRRIP